MSANKLLAADAAAFCAKPMELCSEKSFSQAVDARVEHDRPD
jgi:hypothetical protein